METVDGQPCLTVGELIERLRGFDPALPVLVDGCDCTDNAFGLTQDDDYWESHAPLGVHRSVVYVRRRFGYVETNVEDE